MLDSNRWTPRHHQIALPSASPGHISMPFHSPSQKHVSLWNFSGNSRSWRNLNTKQRCQTEMNWAVSVFSSLALPCFWVYQLSGQPLEKYVFPGKWPKYLLGGVQVSVALGVEGCSAFGGSQGARVPSRGKMSPSCLTLVTYCVLQLFFIDIHSDAQWSSCTDWGRAPS